MKFYSPLRYPGGKNKLAKFVAKICELNAIDGHYVEPYAGGASVALHLLFEAHVSKITINDKDRAIYALWHSILNHSEEFCDLIRKTEVNIDNWKKFRDVLKNKEQEPLLSLGFAAFFLNRTNVSGILNGGPIGNINQTGKYKLDCRFNKPALIERIKKIAEYKSKIRIQNLDALDLIKKIEKETGASTTIFYFDPPYYLKGKSLYMNHYDSDDHEDVGIAIKNIKKIGWIVSYDDALEIRQIYRGCKSKRHVLQHSAWEPQLGKEILFFSPGLKVPHAVHTK